LIIRGSFLIEAICRMQRGRRHCLTGFDKSWRGWASEVGDAPCQGGSAYDGQNSETKADHLSTQFHRAGEVMQFCLIDRAKIIVDQIDCANREHETPAQSPARSELQIPERLFCRSLQMLTVTYSNALDAIFR
jgi:hypothetical protein